MEPYEAKNGEGINIRRILFTTHTFKLLQKHFGIFLY